MTSEDHNALSRREVLARAGLLGAAAALAPLPRVAERYGLLSAASAASMAAGASAWDKGPLMPLDLPLAAIEHGAENALPSLGECRENCRANLLDINLLRFGVRQWRRLRDHRRSGRSHDHRG